MKLCVALTLLSLSLTASAEPETLASVEWRVFGSGKDQDRTIRVEKEPGGARISLINSIPGELALNESAPMAAEDWSAIEAIFVNYRIEPGAHGVLVGGASTSLKIHTNKRGEGIIHNPGRSLPELVELQAPIEALANRVLLKPLWERLGLKKIELAEFNRVGAGFFGIHSMTVEFEGEEAMLSAQLETAAGLRKGPFTVKGKLTPEDRDAVLRRALLYKLPDWQPGAINRGTATATNGSFLIQGKRENRQVWNHFAEQSHGPAQMWDLLGELLDLRLLKPTRDGWKVTSVRLVHASPLAGHPAELVATLGPKGVQVTGTWRTPGKPDDVQTLDVADWNWDHLLQALQGSGLMEWTPANPAGKGIERIVEISGDSSNRQSWRGTCDNEIALKAALDTILRMSFERPMPESRREK